MGIDAKTFKYNSGDLVIIPNSPYLNYEARGSKNLPLIASVELCSEGKNLSHQPDLLYLYGFDKIEPENTYLVLVPFDTEFTKSTFGTLKIMVDIYKAQPLYFQRDLYIYDFGGNEYEIKKIIPRLDKKTFERYAGRNSGLFFLLSDGNRSAEVEYNTLIKNYDIFRP